MSKRDQTSPSSAHTSAAARQRTPQGILAWFAGNSVAANLLMLTFLLLGLAAVATFRFEVFPQPDPRIINVTVVYPNASPGEIDESVNRRVVQAVTGIRGVRRVTSQARDGSGVVTLELEAFSDKDRIQSDVQDAVDRISNFPPEEAREVVVEKIEGRSDAISLALAGGATEAERTAVAREMEDALLALDGISVVELAGVRDEEITISISRTALERYSLTMEQVAQRVRAASLDLASGVLKTSSGNITLQTNARKRTPEDLAAVVLRVLPSGAQLRLGEVAEIRSGFAESQLVNLYNGEPAAFIDIRRAPNEDVLTIERAVRNFVTDYPLPPDMHVEITRNMTDILRSRISLLVRNGMLGFVLVFLCLMLFLDLKLAFWASLTIPLSFIGAMVFASQFNVTINMITLFSLILVLGIVVDDAIVVGESIYHEQEQTPDDPHAALRGLKKVVAPVALGVTTTMIAFVPLAFLSGQGGQIINVLPIIVISVLLVSLIESFLILPAHMGAPGLWSRGVVAWLRERFAAFMSSYIHRVVRPVMAAAIRWRYAVLTGIMVVFSICITAALTDTIRFVFLPTTESSTVRASLTMPAGTSFEQTLAAAQEVQDAAARMDRKLMEEGKDLNPDDGVAAVRQVLMTVGGSEAEANTAKIRMQLLDSEQRAVSSKQVENLWRESIGDIPGMQSLTFRSALFVVSSDVSLDLMHSDPVVLAAAADKLRSALERMSGVSDVLLSEQSGKKQLVFELNSRGRAAGLTESDVARQLRQAFYGEEVQRLIRNSEEVLIMLRYPESERQSIADLQQVRLKLPNGDTTYLSEVVSSYPSRALADIKSVDGKRLVTVTAKVDTSRNTIEGVNAIVGEEIVPALQEEMPGLAWKPGSDREDQKKDTLEMFQMMMIALVLIYVMLASFLRSYFYPLVILSAVPMGIIGAFLGHWLLGYDLTFLSLFGVVALSGVVVNDSILLVDDYLHRRREQPDMPLPQLLVDSVARRFRPIVLTSMTTFLGMMPMLFETSTQARFLIPIAISLGFGIVVATPLLIAVVGLLLMVREDISQLRRRLLSGRRKTAAGGV